MGIGGLINGLLGPFGVRLYRRPSALSGEGFSRQAEESILADLIDHLDPRQYFIDIGAGDGVKDSNTARLAALGWSGVMFECDHEKLSVLAANYAASEGVGLSGGRVTPDNVRSLLEGYGAPDDPGVLSIDIDSYDNSVLDALLEGVRPTIVVSEINEKIPPPLDFTVRYDSEFVWDGTHFYGQSIARLARLASEHEYVLDRLEYNNAFLIDSRVDGRAGLTAQEAYRQGYLDRPDRKRRFPWNVDVDAALEMSPEDALAFFDRFFSEHAGQFELTVGDARD